MTRDIFSKLAMLRDHHLSLCDDVIFRSLLGQENISEGALKELINAVLCNAGEVPIAELQILSPFQFPDLTRGKTTILDVRAHDDAGRFFDVEVQVCSQPSFQKRILYYNAKQYCSQISKGEDYKKLTPVISVVFQKFPIHTDHPEILHNVARLRYDYPPQTIYSDCQQIHHIYIPDHFDLSSFQNSNLAQWIATLNFPNTEEKIMETIITSNPEIENLFERLRGLVDDDRFQLYLEGAEKARRDQADRLDGARAEGKAEGEAIGEARGRAEGRAEGEAIGEARGRAEGEAIGEARGRAEGRAEGEARGIASGKKTLLSILTKRLGPLPESLTARIRSLDDLDEIDRLSDIALDVPTLDEFIKQLR